MLAPGDPNSPSFLFYGDLRSVVIALSVTNLGNSVRTGKRCITTRKIGVTGT